MAFRFPCYRDLKQKLGEFDALCECVELATRDLNERASAAPDQHAFVGELSRHHGIRVNRLDVPAIRPHVARMYILTVYQCLEDFLFGLRKEHPKGTHWDMEDNASRPKEDRATKLARAVGFTHTLDFDVCQFYRAIRNATMHPSARVPQKETVSALRQRVAQEECFRTLDAPNPYDAISFDDFVLFTRSAKTFAEELCDVARPTDEELASIVHARTVKLAGKLRKNPKRLENARSTFLQTTYSLTKAESDKIVAGLLA